MRKIDQNLRKKWGKWNSCPPGTVRLATALLITWAMPFVAYDFFPLMDYILKFQNLELTNSEILDDLLSMKTLHTSCVRHYLCWNVRLFICSSSLIWSMPWRCGIKSHLVNSGLLDYYQQLRCIAFLAYYPILDDIDNIGENVVLKFKYSSNTIIEISHTRPNNNLIGFLISSCQCWLCSIQGWGSTTFLSQPSLAPSWSESLVWIGSQFVIWNSWLFEARIWSLVWIKRKMIRFVFNLTLAF